MNRCRQMNNIILTVPEEAGGLRLDKWLTSQIEDLTRTAVRILLKAEKYWSTVKQLLRIINKRQEMLLK